MKTPDDQRQAVVEHARRSYRDCYSRMRFPSPEISMAAERRRSETLSEIARCSEVLCAGTKFVVGTLSTGCTLCATGTWSCLFVNGRCNAECFFCPKDRDPGAKPNADGIVFRSVHDYMEYLRRGGFSGVGISGGEPLLSRATTLDFIGGIKREFGPATHVWLYTNGMTASKETLEKLRETGLDEIRFNIAAAGYSIESVECAARLFENVVVEIPAIPEDGEKIKQALPALTDLGVRCLNLHQLWCSPQNANELIERDYTFLHGPRIAVLESELLALDLLESGLKQNDLVPIHYCSSVFKQRFQTAAALSRDARLVARAFEEVSQAGLVRQLSLSGSETDLNRQVRLFEDVSAKRSDYHFDSASGRLFFRTKLWNRVEFPRFITRLQYEVVHPPMDDEQISSSVTIPIAEELELRLTRSLVHVQPSMSEFELALFEKRVVKGEHGPAVPYGSFEWIDSGLPDYF